MWCRGKNVQNCHASHIDSDVRSIRWSTFILFARFSLLKTAQCHFRWVFLCCRLLTKPHNRLTKRSIRNRRWKTAAVTATTKKKPKLKLIDICLDPAKEQTTYRCQYDWFGCWFFFPFVPFAVGSSTKSEKCYIDFTCKNKTVRERKKRTKTKQFRLFSFTFQTEITFMAIEFTLIRFPDICCWCCCCCHSMSCLPLICV